MCPFATGRFCINRRAVSKATQALYSLVQQPAREEVQRQLRNGEAFFAYSDGTYLPDSQASPSGSPPMEIFQGWVCITPSESCDTASCGRFCA